MIKLHLEFDLTISAWVVCCGVIAVVCVSDVIPNIIAGRTVVIHKHNDFLIIIVKNGEILFK